MPDLPPDLDTVQSFGLAPALRARLMGSALVGLGVLLLVVTVLVYLSGLPLDVLTVVVVLAVVGVFALGAALVRRWYVVRLDDVGYTVRFVRGAGVRAARWDDVQDVVTATVAGARCVVVRLRDGRSTTIPVDLIEGDSEEFVRAVGRRLGPRRR